MKRKILFVISLLSFAIAACSTIKTASEKPPLDFQSIYLNQQIALLAPPEFNTFKTTDWLYLLNKPWSGRQI